MKADLHIHTNHSPDSWVPPEKLPLIAKRKGLQGVAVTDHSRFSACAEVEKAARGSGILVIKGEEIGVKPQGKRVCEIIGLFLDEEISGMNRTPLEVIDEIRKQDGIVVLPHPFDSFRDVLPPEQLARLARKVDAVEVFNPRVIDPRHNEEAKKFAKKHGLAETAGSDSHTTWEVGRAWTEADAGDLEGFRKALLSRRTSAHGSYSPALTRIFPKLAQLRSKVKKRLRL